MKEQFNLFENEETQEKKEEKKTEETIKEITPSRKKPNLEYTPDPPLEEIRKRFATSGEAATQILGEDELLSRAEAQRKRKNKHGLSRKS
jgi:hypothetical protein